MSAFAKWYDVLYTHKNYQQEIETILSFSKEFAQNYRDFLEIGGGTGNHTLRLASHANRLQVVEKDPAMGILGQQKTAHLPQVSWHIGTVETLSSNQSADVALALFNVINYVLDEAALISFLSHLHQQIKPGGVFVFDGWNGELPLGQAEEEKRFLTVDHLQIEKKIKTTIDKKMQRAELAYQIKISNSNELIEEFSEKIAIRLWTVEELMLAGEKSGFKIAAIRSHQQPQEPLEPSANRMWMILTK